MVGEAGISAILLFLRLFDMFDIVSSCNRSKHMRGLHQRQIVLLSRQGVAEIGSTCAW